MLSKIACLLAQPQLQKWARCSKAIFPLMFTFGGKLSQVLHVPEHHYLTHPPLRNASLPHVATEYNKCTGGVCVWEGWFVSI
jgi:hypothetical protein